MELGETIKKLGFGLMRLPMEGDRIDLEQVKRMVDLFMQRGFTYFDTAYVYHDGHSEEVAREALVERYPRESFQLATKLPIWSVKQEGDVPRIFDEQLARSGAGYFDFYLLHSLSKDKLPELDRYHAWEFVQEQKKKGLVKHAGFSFHDTPEVLEEILEAHPEAEFVQLQINYIDWDSAGVQSRRCYEVARKHGKPVVIMEPVKGGSLASMRPEIEEIFRRADPQASVASWAVRFAASLPGVITVLSGMSNLEQLRDNTGFMEHFRPLSDGERAVIGQVVERLNATPTVPCTGCRYCVPGCPQGIPIPEIFRVLNHHRVYGHLSESKRRYAEETKTAKASDCIACGQCEGICPQHIPIIDALREAAETLE